MIPQQEDLELMIKNTKLSNQDDIRDQKPGLILVATLIDKGTNLGGLCRTCEIFNVKELVIGNIRFIEDKQFQSLSVTAEKWLNIKEVSFLFEFIIYLIMFKFLKGFFEIFEAIFN